MALFGLHNRGVSNLAADRIKRKLIESKGTSFSVRRLPSSPLQNSRTRSRLWRIYFGRFDVSFEYKQQKGVVARLSLLCCGWLPDSGCPHTTATAGICILLMQKEKGAASRSIAPRSDKLGGTVTFTGFRQFCLIFFLSTA